MSAGNFKQLVANKMLENLNRASQKQLNEASRLLMESALVNQCFVLNLQAMNQLEIGFRAGIAPAELDPAARKKYRSRLRRHIEKKAKKSIPDELTKGLYGDIIKARRLTWGKTVFFMGISFDSIKKVIRRFHEDFADKQLNTSFDQEAFTGTTQFDHGKDGPAQGTFGVATFGVSTALDSGIDKKKLLAITEQNLQALAVKEFGAQKGTAIARRLYNFVASFEQVVNPDGTISAGASLFVTALDKDGNLSRAPFEKKEQELILKALEMSVQQHLNAQQYLDFIGSSTLKEKYSKVILDKFVNNITENKDLQKIVKLDPKVLKASLKSSAKTDGNKTKTVKSKAGGKTPKGGKLATLNPAGRGGRKQRAQQSKVSLQTFLAVLNSQLNKRVQKNMGSPKLENQTGRFATSVRAIDIQSTARGFPSVGYTYQRQPYGVFESTSGSRFASSDRDPRRLIEQSIREIAAENQIGRLFARRV